MKTTLRLAPKSKEYGFRLASNGSMHWHSWCLTVDEGDKGEPCSYQMAGCLLQAELWRREYKERHLQGQEFAEAYAQKHLWRAQAKLFEVK